MGNRSFSILQYRLCVPIAEKEEKYGAEIEKLIVKLFLLEAERMGVTYKSHYFEKDCVVFTFPRIGLRRTGLPVCRGFPA